MGFFNLRDTLSGLVNSLTGVGTPADPTMASGWTFNQPSDHTLSALYRSTWLAQKIINVPIDDMLREGWIWQAEDSEVTKLDDEELRLGFKEKLRQALVRDAIYGGSAILLGVDVGDPSEELVPESVGRGALKYLLVLGKGELEVKEIERDPVEGYGQPKMFRLIPVKGQTVDIHPSRVITFVGKPIIDNGSIQELSFWGDSTLSSLTRDIAAANAATAGIGRIMNELAVTYYKIAGFTEAMATTGGEQQIQRTLTALGRMKSIMHAVAIDAEDDFEVINATLSGAEATLRSLMQNLAGAADIPYTRLMGSSPDGMNATGASDIRNYYDRLAGRRGAYIEPGIERLDEILIRSALGSNPDNVYRIWNPLWQLDETQQLDLDTKKITMLIEMKNSMLVHDHVVEEVTRNSMIESPSFPGAEKAFKEADAMPDPDPVELAAAAKLQAGGGQPPTSGTPPRVVGGTEGDMDDGDWE